MRMIGTYRVGSSPLTRGKPARRGHRRQPRRLIPAHAGKTRRTRCPTKSPVGSSPLTRGKHLRCPLRKQRVRLIPAHAGKTPPTSATCSLTKAHPRSRGENAVTAGRTRLPAGSSPLTRGKLLRPGRATTPRRLIPAHAGKTFHGRPVERTRPAHPRSRGENGGSSSPQRLQVGSSPLTRGKLFGWFFSAMLTRLIPAHAGKTDRCPPRSLARPAHPRSRGENVGAQHLAGCVDGSSPLTRGKRGD